MTIGPTTKTVQNVIDHVKRQFGDESGVQVTDADIIRWINTGQVEILNKNPILKARAATSTVSGQYEYTLPTDILRIQSIMYNGSPIRYMSFQEAQEYVVNNDPLRTKSGSPTVWFEWAGALNLFPTPDVSSDDALVIYYVKVPTAVTTGTDLLSVPDTYYNAMLHYVMEQAYEQDDDWTASGNKSSQFESSVLTLANEENYSNMNTYPTITILPEDM